MVNPEAWIDPEVVALNGITPEELRRYKAPAPYVRPETPVPQSELDAGGPHMVPPEAFENFMAMPDEEVLAAMSETEPPVKVAK